MKNSSPASLRELLVDQLCDLYDAEKQLVDALPKMADAATGDNLKQGFLDHLDETKGHVDRLEQAFEKLGVEPMAKTCAAMKGLVIEGSEAIEMPVAGALRDTALVGAARRVEHYEMAAYVSARGLAGAVDEESVTDLLQMTLDEEVDADKRLCSLAEPLLEAAKVLTNDPSNGVAKGNPPKLGKKKQK